MKPIIKEDNIRYMHEVPSNNAQQALFKVVVKDKNFRQLDF